MNDQIGVLVVHGIGSQEQGESLHNCLHDLLDAYEGVELLDTNGLLISLDTIRALRLDRVILRQGDWQVRFYEVYWAPILGGTAVEGTYNSSIFEETTWYPWLNWHSKILPVGQYPKALLYFRTMQLWLLGLAATLLDIVYSEFHTFRAKVLDQMVSDVTNYAHSMIGDLPSSSPIVGASEKILALFRETAALAASEGCNELHVVAHSLGTVIAYNALTRYPATTVQIPNACNEDNPPVLITRFYTIGSPLEKFRFIWTPVIFPCSTRLQVWHDSILLATAKNLLWINYFSPFDVVSGRLTHFTSHGDVVNKRVWGLGGLVNAHVSYFINPTVLADLSRGLRGPSISVARPLGKRAAFVCISLAQSLALLLLLIVSLLASLAVSFLFAILLGGVSGLVITSLLWVAGLPLALVDLSVPLRSVWLGWTLFCGALFVPFVIFFFTKDGYNRSLTRHSQQLIRLAVAAENVTEA